MDHEGRNQSQILCTNHYITLTFTHYDTFQSCTAPYYNVIHVLPMFGQPKSERRNPLFCYLFCMVLRKLQLLKYFINLILKTNGYGYTVEYGYGQTAN